MPGVPGIGVGGSAPIVTPTTIVAKHATITPAISTVTPRFELSASTAIRITYAGSSGLYGPPVKYIAAVSSTTMYFTGRPYSPLLPAYVILIAVLALNSNLGV